MNMNSTDQILRLAHKFFILASMSFHHSFLWNLANLVDTEVSQENLDSWISKNNSVLDPIQEQLEHPWALSRDRNDYYLASFIDGNRYARIYKTPDLPIDLKVSTISFLQSDGSIPNLWVMIGEQVAHKLSSKSEIFQKLDPKIAAEGWLVEILLNMVMYYDSDTIVSEITDFVNKNMPTINKIRSMMKYHRPKTLPEGESTTGVAMQINDNMILKIFDQEYDAQKAKESMDRLWSDPELARTEPMIYDVGSLGMFVNTPIFYSIMEKMKPVSSLNVKDKKTIEHLIELIGESVLDKSQALETVRNDLFDLSKRTIVNQTINVIVQQIAREINVINKDVIDAITKSLDLKQNWFPLLIEEIIIKFLTHRGDIHAGNIGITNQHELRYFDPSHSAWKHNLNYKAE